MKAQELINSNRTLKAFIYRDFAPFPHLFIPNKLLRPIKYKESLRMLKKAKYPKHEFDTLVFFLECIKRSRDESGNYYRISPQIVLDVLTTKKYCENIAFGLISVVKISEITSPALINDVLSAEIVSIISQFGGKVKQENDKARAVKAQMKREAVRASWESRKEESLKDAQQALLSSRKPMRTGKSWLEAKSKWKDRFVPSERYKNLDEFATFATDFEINK